MRILILILAALGAVFSAAAQSPTTASSPLASPTPACVAPEFRQLDFWLGKWKVISANGKQVGTSEITRVAEGCAIREQWISVRGTTGTSLNYYDAGNGQWHQDWVGGDGIMLHLHGGLKEGSMVLRGETRSSKGSLINRITFTQMSDGKVRQEWATSVDNGHTWQISFLGSYEKQT
jgi:hypothetical protein